MGPLPLDSMDSFCKEGDAGRTRTDPLLPLTVWIFL